MSPKLQVSHAKPDETRGSIIQCFVCETDRPTRSHFFRFAEWELSSIKRHELTMLWQQNSKGRSSKVLLDFAIIIIDQPAVIRIERFRRGKLLQVKHSTSEEGAENGKYIGAISRLRNKACATTAVVGSVTYSMSLGGCHSLRACNRIDRSAYGRKVCLLLVDRNSRANALLIKYHHSRERI